jgi:glycosyltransferase involved in cell wall biosynthesis
MNDDDSFAAAGKACRDFALELSELGHEVYVLAPQFAGEATTFGRLKIHRFSWGTSSGRRLSMLKPSRPAELLEMMRFVGAGVRECVRMCRAERIDQVMAMWAVPAGLFGLAAKVCLGVPYTVWALGADIWVYGRSPLSKGIVRRVLKSAGIVYADGEQLCREVERLSGRKCAFLAHLPYIHMERFQDVQLESEKRNLLYVGRWESPKGIDVLMDALSHLQGDDYRLNVIGGGALESVVRDQIARHRLGAVVRLLGWVDQRTLVGYLKASDAVVIPSRIESIPCVYSEAMMAGVPVIATDVGDMGDLTRKYRVGVVSRPEDPPGLARAIEQFYEGDREAYAKNTQNLAREWNLATSVQRYLGDLAGGV